MKNFTPYFRIEGLGITALSAALFLSTDAPWWLLPALFLTFDISAIGYTVNPRIGAHTYNVVHNYALPALLIAIALFTDTETLKIIGSCWLFHVSVDRALGYGLKHSDSFMHTHLGFIGNQKPKK